MITLGYLFLHNDDGCQVGPVGAARPMSHALMPVGLGHNIMVLEHGYQSDMWEISSTLIGATSRALCGAKCYTVPTVVLGYAF